MESSCPTAVQLEELLRGTLAPAESVALDEHLALCAACRQRLDALAGDNESWLEAKQKSPARAADSPSLRAAMNRLKGTELIPPSEKAGDRIGRYKLLQQIGEGGCGVVYMAEQSEPVRRRVALKIIKLGMDTKSVIARFEGERQALALMDHPNIAKVFDAGATETGRPYFVMELVRGVKITDYCDEAKLSTRARLDLFMQVCQAIQHAHQKGIIHRDIKPSNILVTVNDGVPLPKVIDFGIAKATSGQQLTDKTIFTAFEQFIGTPAYMSPEQAVMTSLDIDTRSDIYALGVLLYELLTGKTPFDAEQLLASGLDEMRRAIREQEPPRPSTRLSTLAQKELSTTAQRRGLEAPKLVSELRGDLDWIVMKALEKDRARRYETANGLAADVQRHLDNEPVAACPPSTIYRLRKTVRRNKLAFAAGSAVAASLVIGLTLSTVLFFRERAAQKRANEQAVKANEHAAKANEQAAIAKAVNDFLQEDLLEQADTISQRMAGFTPDSELTVREVLERAAGRIGDRFKDQPLQEAAVRMTIGRALAGGGIGEFQQSIPHFQRALELRRTHLSPNHPETLESMYQLALAYDARVRGSGQALQLLEETLSLRKAILGANHPDTVKTMASLAEAYHFASRDDKAFPLLEEAMKLRLSIVRLDEVETRITMRNLALAYLGTGQPERAVAVHEDLVKMADAKFGPDHQETGYAVSGLAWVYRKTGKLDQLEALYRKWLAAEWTNGPDAKLELGCLLLEISKTDQTRRAQELARESEQLLREYLADVRNRYTNNLLTLTGKLYDLADFFYRQGQYAEAEPLYREIIKRRGTRWTKETSQVLEPTASLARLLSDWAWAEHNSKSEVRNPKSEIADRAREAERLLRDVLELQLRRSTNSWRIGDVKTRLGGALVCVAVTDSTLDAEGREAKFSEAESLLLDGYEWLQKRSNDPKYKRDARRRIDRLYKVWKKPARRDDWQQKQLASLRKAADKGNVVALNDLAWFLATCSDAGLRDGSNAVTFAEKAVAITNRKDPTFLDTLAAAYAEVGDFAKAVDAQVEALAVLHDEKEKEGLESRLKLYQSKAPYREP